jgi:hypothetical protein
MTKDHLFSLYLFSRFLFGFTQRYIHSLGLLWIGSVVKVVRSHGCLIGVNVRLTIRLILVEPEGYCSRVQLSKGDKYLREDQTLFGCGISDISWSSLEWGLTSMLSFCNVQDDVIE